jgi:hypothetical protein
MVVFVPGYESGMTKGFPVTYKGVNKYSYEALVCVFRLGGSDANDTLVPTDTVGYNNYATLGGPLALPQSQLIEPAFPAATVRRGSLTICRQLCRVLSTEFVGCRRSRWNGLMGWPYSVMETITVFFVQ